MVEPIRVVQIADGKLKGKIAVDYKGGYYYSFQGIPYAKPPVGELRFKAPLPAEPWQGIKDATKEGSESLGKHMLFNYNIGSEDCLNLNVYTPESPKDDNKKQLKPVMVFIHGGGFVGGSNKTDIYGPDYLITEDIVLVTINYRVGILGFLSLEDSSLQVPGNAGLKDMVLALKWVQKNIAHFNGDPNNVTIFGESAGSAAVHYLILSPKAKGLFHRAIMQSGCVLNPWALSRRSASDVVAILGFQEQNEREILKYLQSLPAERFYEVMEKMPDYFGADKLQSVGPIVEKPHPNAFLTEQPLDIIQSGNYNKVPMIFGYTSKEGMLLLAMQMKVLQKVVYPFNNFEHTIGNYYHAENGSELSKKAADLIQKYYYPDGPASFTDMNKFYDLESDIFFTYGIYRSVINHVKTTDQPIYLYRFSCDSRLNFFKLLLGIKHPGACHADDIGYLFKTALTPYIEPNGTEERLIWRFVKYWTSFARDGNPNPKVSTDPDEQLLNINVNWLPVTKEKTHFLELDNELTVGVNPDQERLEFWDSISKLLQSNI